MKKLASFNLCDLSAVCWNTAKKKQWIPCKEYPLYSGWECMCAKAWPTLCNPMDCRWGNWGPEQQYKCLCSVASVVSDSVIVALPESSVHGIPGKNTGVGCHAPLQGIFLTQGSSPSLLHLWHWQSDSSLLMPPGRLLKIYIRQLNIEKYQHSA